MDLHEFLICTFYVTCTSCSMYETVSCVTSYRCDLLQRAAQRLHDFPSKLRCSLKDGRSQGETFYLAASISRCHSDQQNANLVTSRTIVILVLIYLTSLENIQTIKYKTKIKSVQNSTTIHWRDNTTNMTPQHALDPRCC